MGTQYPRIITKYNLSGRMIHFQGRQLCLNTFLSLLKRSLLLRKMMVWCFTSLSTLFKSYRGEGWWWYALCNIAHCIVMSWMWPLVGFKPRTLWSKDGRANYLATWMLPFRENLHEISNFIFWEKKENNISKYHLLKFIPSMLSVNSLPTSGDFCCLLITFANSLDPDEAR